jgi:hypothetical protein
MSDLTEAKLEERVRAEFPNLSHVKAYDISVLLFSDCPCIVVTCLLDCVLD